MFEEICKMILYSNEQNENNVWNNYEKNSSR